MTVASPIIRPLVSEGDRDEVWRLWQQSLADQWPFPEEWVKERTQEGFVAIEDGNVIGACITSHGNIQLVVVDGRWRRQGVGRALVDRSKAASTRPLGIGGGKLYFWPGVPRNLPHAEIFTRACGFDIRDECWDLRGSLVDEDQARLSKTAIEGLNSDISLSVATADDMPELLAFEARHFPEWVEAYRLVKAPKNIVLSRKGGIVAGTLLVGYPGEPAMWLRSLGPETTTIAAVGVDPKHQGMHIGTGLVAFASDILRAAGGVFCVIDWVVRLGFYGRLGYAPWRAYLRLPYEG